MACAATHSSSSKPCGNRAIWPRATSGLGPPTPSFRMLTAKNTTCLLSNQSKMHPVIWGINFDGEVQALNLRELGSNPRCPTKNTLPRWWNGIHGGLKIHCRKACGFESHPGHHIEAHYASHYLVAKVGWNKMPPEPTYCYFRVRENAIHRVSIGSVFQYGRRVINSYCNRKSWLRWPEIM